MTETPEMQFAETAQPPSFDALTLALTRPAFLAELAAQAQSAARSGNVFSLLLLDVDHLQNINDCHGINYDKYDDGKACATGVGRLCEILTSHELARKYTYDSKGRTTQVSQVVGDKSFAASSVYDARGNRAS